MPEHPTHGTIHHDAYSDRKTDYLYRVSIKCLVRNEKGEILVVKETNRTAWDLPGGGMDHGEDIKTAIAREMKEEVNLQGDFTYKILTVDEPVYLPNHHFWQLRLIFELNPENLTFTPGEDGDEVMFADPVVFKESEHNVERHVYLYSTS
jgi:ADP-ribose pyrophosphatase YjhB (NUDIX family)